MTKVVSANALPEYTLELARNVEGDEIVRMLRRGMLSVRDPRYELPRNPRRRYVGGIRQKALRLL